MSIKFEFPSNVDVFNASALTSDNITATNVTVTSSFFVDGFRIDLTGGASLNQVLQYNGTKFVAATLGGTLSGSLTNTKIPYATGTSTLADSGMSWNAGSSIFTVTTASNTAGLKVTDGTHIIEMKPDNVNNVSSFGSGSNHDLVFYTNGGAQQLRLTTGGKFGITSGTVTYDLDVTGDSRTTSRYLINGSSASVSPSNMGAFRYNSTTQHIEFSEDGGSWQQIVSSSGTVSGSFTTGTVPYANSSTSLVDSGLTWDNTNQLFGVGQPAPIARLDVSQASATSGNPMAMRVLGGSMTTMPASTEILDIYFDFGRTIQRNTGAVSTQRSILITAPTYSFVGASTITAAASFAIEGAPSPGTNATITNPYAIWIQSGLSAFDGHIKVDGYTIDISGGATSGQVLAYNGTKFVATSNGATIGGTITATKVPYASSSNTLSDSNMSWDSSNKILTLTTNSSTLGLTVTEGTRVVALGVDSTSNSGQVGTSSNHNLTFLANNAIKMTLTAADGYLGIGASPSYPLHISGDGYLTSRLIVGGNAAAVSPSSTGAIRYNTSTNHLEFSENGGAWTQFGAGGGGGMSIGGSITSSTPGSVLYVDSSSNLAQDNSNFFWDATNKRLGIGTTGPSFPIHISKSDNTGTGVQLRVSNTSTSTASYGTISFSGNNGAVIGLAVADGLGTGPLVTASTYFGSNTNHPMGFITNNTERARFLSGGGLAIAGTSIRDSGKLDVSGTAVFGSDTGGTVPAVVFNSGSGGMPIAQFKVNDGTTLAQLIGFNAATSGLLNGLSVDLPTSAFFGIRGNSNTNVWNIDAYGSIISVPRAYASGTPISYQFTGPAHTALTASTETMDAYYKLDRTVQFTNGALTTQRAIYISAPTYAFTGPSTITTAATLTVGNAPQQGANATITKAYSIWAQAGLAAFDEHIKVDGYTIDISGGAANTQVLAYNGTKFVPTNAGSGSISGSISANQVAYGSGASAIQGSANLTYDGTTLTVAQHISVDGYLIDISAGATTNQVLKFNGSAFVAAADSGGGGGGFGTSGEKVNSTIRIGGRSSYGSSSPLAVGAVAFNPDDYILTGTTRSIKLRAVAANGNSGLTTHVKLRNITDSEDVATLDFTSTSSTKQETTLTIGNSAGNIKTSEKIYEVRVYVDSPVSGIDTIELYSAELLMINTIT